MNFVFLSIKHSKQRKRRKEVAMSHLHRLSIGHYVGQSVRRLVGHGVCQSVRHMAGHCVRRSVSLSFGQSLRRSVGLSFGWSLISFRFRLSISLLRGDHYISTDY